MAMKDYTVAMKFPQAAASKHWQATTVKAPDFGLAARRAFQQIRKRDGIKGKRFNEITITITENKNDNE